MGFFHFGAVLESGTEGIRLETPLGMANNEGGNHQFSWEAPEKAGDFLATHFGAIKFRFQESSKAFRSRTVIP